MTAVSGLASYNGSPFTQSNMMAMGWNGQVQQWGHYLESNADYGLYSFGAGSPVRVMWLTSGGAATFAASVTAPVVVQSSDISLKNVIGGYAPRDLSSLSLKDWRWKSDDKYSIGLIAQDVQKVAPEYVHASEDGLLAIDKAAIALERVAYLEGIMHKAGLL